MRRRILALGGAVVLAVAACSSGAHHAAPTTPPPPPPTTAAPNPDVIPPVITVQYVNAVFAVLNHINGDVSRGLLASGQVTPQARTDLRAIYDDPLFEHEITIAQQSLSGNLGNVRRPPGDVVTTVRSLITASRNCVFVETRGDFSAVLIHPSPPAASEYFGLAMKQSGMDPDHINPTPWAISFNATYLKPTTIPDQCPAS